ncbi:MAG: N-acetylmuramoyl-L-alanine amidase family protein [Clostridia bacterium]
MRSNLRNRKVITQRKKSTPTAGILFSINTPQGPYPPPQIIRWNGPKVDSIDGIPLTVDLIPNGSEGRPGTKRTVQYVVIHETGNTDPGTGASNHARLLASGENGSTSWHYTVDDHEIYQHLPDNEVGWHCGDGREGPGNQTGIGIELCVNPEGDFDSTFDNAARLTAYLLEAYELTLQDVRQHYDFSGKDCPEQIREQNRWEEFLEVCPDLSQRLI